MKASNRVWTQKNSRRFESADGCVVKVDESVACNTSKPWLKNYRGWIAFGPGDEGYIGFLRRNSYMRIPKKFKTQKTAMAAVDAEYPPSEKAGQS